MKSWKLGSPPRRRGKDKAEHLVQDHIGITPAQAGKRCYLCASTKSSWDHPRVGGEKAKITPRLKRCRGSPPHGRGKVGTVTAALGDLGITPAWAGKSDVVCPFLHIPEDHPRMGGEKHLHTVLPVHFRGSPPHGRGKADKNDDSDEEGRITPAWAGKSYKFPVGLLPTWDHPRMGGEKISFFFTGCSPRGSPPHGRGKGQEWMNEGKAERITPAWAGKRYFGGSFYFGKQDHPRMGGEKRTKTTTVTKKGGSPPHGRGKVFVT